MESRNLRAMIISHSTRPSHIFSDTDSMSPMLLMAPGVPPVARIEVPGNRQGKRVEMVLYCAYLHPNCFGRMAEVMNLTFSLGLKDAGFDANCEMVEIELKKTELTRIAPN